LAKAGFPNLHLKWQAKTNPGFKNPYCELQPTGRIQIGQNAAGLIVGKDPNTSSASVNTPENSATPFWNQNIPLQYNDDVFISWPKYTTYQLACCEGDTKQASGNFLAIGCATSNTFVPISAKFNITEAKPREPCEVPLASIIESLKNNQHTFITEEGMDSWFTTKDMEDYISYGSEVSNWPLITPKNGKLGSGTDGDLLFLMSQFQASTTINNIDGLKIFSEAGLGAIKDIQKFNSGHQPTLLSMIFVPSDELEKIMGNDNPQGHAVIALKTEEIIANQKYKLTILDPGMGEDGPTQLGVRDIYCRGQSVSAYNKTYFGVVCEYAPGFLGMPMFLDLTTPLAVNFTSYCRQHSESKFCKERQSNLSLWLENNYPHVPNMEGYLSNQIGVCRGWSELVLRLAYLGDFVGTDYHPDDGKYVGTDCDANHYPITPAKSTQTDSTNWLANVWSVWQGLIRQQ